MNATTYIEQTTLLLHAFAGAVKTLGKMNLHDGNISQMSLLTKCYRVPIAPLA